MSFRQLHVAELDVGTYFEMWNFDGSVSAMCGA